MARRIKKAITSGGITRRPPPPKLQKATQEWAPTESEPLNTVFMSTEEELEQENEEMVNWEIVSANTDTDTMED